MKFKCIYYFLQDENVGTGNVQGSLLKVGRNIFVKRFCRIKKK